MITNSALFQRWHKVDQVCGLSDVPDYLLLKATTTVLSCTGLIQDLSVDIWNSFQCQKKKNKKKTRLCILNSYLLMCLETDFSTIPLFQVTPVKN